MAEITLVPMRHSDSEVETVYDLKREALGPHIIPTWGWDEPLQRATIVEKMNIGSYFEIFADGVPVGTVAINQESDHINIDDFYITPSRQNQGIGSMVMARILADANEKQLPAQIGTQRWNPAVTLYKRHGFAVVSETETHVSLKRSYIQSES